MKYLLALLLTVGLAATTFAAEQPAQPQQQSQQQPQPGMYVATPSVTYQWVPIQPVAPVVAPIRYRTPVRSVLFGRGDYPTPLRTITFGRYQTVGWVPY